MSGLYETLEKRMYNDLCLRMLAVEEKDIDSKIERLTMLVLEAPGEFSEETLKIKDRNPVEYIDHCATNDGIRHFLVDWHKRQGAAAITRELIEKG